MTSKIHAVVDSNGLPVRLALSAGEANDVRLAGKLLSRLKSGSMLLADRGYDADWIRELAMKKGAWANIPPKSNRSDPICFSPYLYRARSQVQRFFNRIKQCRRVATRYDRLAANDLAFVQLASIRLWLRLYESAPYFRRRVLPRPLLDDDFMREGLEHRTRAIGVDVAQQSRRAVPVVLPSRIVGHGV